MNQSQFNKVINDVNSEDEAALCNDKLSVINASNQKADDTISDQGFLRNNKINKNKTNTLIESLNTLKPLEHQIKTLKTEMKGAIEQKRATRKNSDIETNLTSEQ